MEERRHTTTRPPQTGHLGGRGNNRHSSHGRVEEYSPSWEAIDDQRGALENLECKKLRGFKRVENRKGLQC